MADPAALARALGYTEETAPQDMRWLYRTLAPKPGTEYGDVLPAARDADGSIRAAMPSMMREGLAGILDLLAGTQTGEVTPRAAASITMGGLGVGGGMAPRGALAAGGARAAKPAVLPMDETARFARAREMGFRPDIPLFHGTAGPDFPAFQLSRAGATSGQPTAGVWAAENPALANWFAENAAANQETGARVIPLVSRFEKPGNIRLAGDEDYHEVMATIGNAFDNGYDAVRLLNYTGIPELGPQNMWAFRDPKQLRARFAKFDPAKRGSADLLASILTGSPVVPTGFTSPIPPGARVPAPPNSMLPYEERVY